MNPFDLLLSGILPHTIMAIFAIIILSLFCVYYLFLVIRAFPWRRTPETSAHQTGQGMLKKRRRRVRHQRQR